MLVEVLFKGTEEGPRMLDFETPPLVGDYVYVLKDSLELMYVVGARFWRLTEKDELGLVLGKETKIKRRRHTLFVGLELVSSVELMMAAQGLEPNDAEKH